MVFTFSDPTTWSDSDFIGDNLSTTALASMTATIASQITSGQMGKFSAAQIEAFPTSTVSSIVAIDGIDASAISSIADFSLMTEAQIKLLTNPQIYALASNKKLTSFTAVQLGYLTFAQTKQLTYSYTVSISDTSGIAQLKDLSYLQVRALSHITHAEILTTAVISEQLSTSTSYWMQKLSASQLGSLSTAQFTAIVPAQFGYFSKFQMAGFTYTHMTNLSLAQFQAITGTSGTGTNDATDSLVSAISGITTDAIDNITAVRFASITESQLGALTTSQIPVLTNDQVSYLPGSAVSSSVPSTSQMAVFTGGQVAKFASGKNNFFNVLSADQVNALAEDYGVSRIQYVSTDAITTMKPEVIHALNTVPTGSLTSDQLAVLGTYTSSYDQVQALNVADLKDHITYLSFIQISKLTTEAGISGSNTSASTNGQIGDLTYGANSTTNQIRLLSAHATINKMATGFTVEQIHVVSLDQFKEIHANAFDIFTAAKLAAFQNKNINNLSTDQFAKINLTITNITGFRYTKETNEIVNDITRYGWIQAISTDRIKELTSSQFSGLTVEQIPGLSLDQVAVLPRGAVSSSVPSELQIKAFTVSDTTASNSVVANQVEKIPAAYVSAFTTGAINTTGQLNYFTTTQFAQLSQAAIKILSNTQLAGLDIDHVGALTKSQLITLDSTTSDYNLWTATISGQVAALKPAGITTVQLANSVTGFDDAQIKNFSSAQIKVFSDTQLEKVVSDIRLNNFSTLTNVGELSFKDVLPLSAWQISRLYSANMGYLSKEHLKNLNSPTKVAAITITAISKDKVSSLDTTKLTFGERQTIAPSTTESDAGDNIQSSSVIPQIEFMSEDQVQQLTIDNFTEGQVQALHIPYVTATQIGKLAKVGYLSVTTATTTNALKIQGTIFSSNQSITSGTISVSTYKFPLKNAGTTQGQIEQLSDAQIRGFTSLQIPKLTAAQLKEEGGFTQQQMKYFTDYQVKQFSSIAIYQKDGTTSGATASYVNQFAAMGNNLMYLPYSQYALVRTAITSGMSDNQKSKEDDYHKLARLKTVTSKLASIISGLTEGENAYDINEKSTFSVINDKNNPVPDGLLHMLNAEQVALLDSTRIPKVKSTNITTISANANYANMSKEAQDVLANNILGSEYNRWLSLGTYVNSSAYGYTPSTYTGSYTYPPLAVLGAMSNEQVASLKAATLVRMYANAININTTADRLAQINAISNLSNLVAAEVEDASKTETYGGPLLNAIAEHLTPAHFSELSEDVVKKINSTAWGKILPSNIPYIKEGAFTSGFQNTASITALQAEKMTYKQVNNLHDIDSLKTEVSNNAVAAIFSANPAISANDMGKILPAQIGKLGSKIKYIDPTVIGNLDPAVFGGSFAATASITELQAKAMTTNQVNQLTDIGNLETVSYNAVAAIFRETPNISITNIIASQIGKLGAKIQFIHPSLFGDIKAAAFGGSFAATTSIIPAQIAKMKGSQVAQLSVDNAKLLTTAQMAKFSELSVALDGGYYGFTSTQIKALSSAQINAATVEGKRILMLILDGAIGPLNIELSGFNTTVLAGLLSSFKEESIVLESSDATVQVKMTKDQAAKAFKYAYGSDGKVRLYVDKKEFKLYYNHSATSAVSGLLTSKVESTATATNVLKWNGNVTENSISKKEDPLTWDFIHHVATETYTSYVYASLFTNVTTSESTLENNINTAVNTVVYNILNAFDIANSSGSIVNTSTSFEKIKDDDNEYYIVIDPSILSSEKYNIPSIIFNSLYKQQPERFTSASSSTIPTNSEYDTKVGMPFRTNDTLNFLVTITPNDEQRVLDTKVGMASATDNTGDGSTARVKERIYKMQILIENN